MKFSRILRFVAFLAVAVSSFLPARGATNFTVAMVGGAAVSSYAFRPANLTINVGDSVRWTNTHVTDSPVAPQQTGSVTVSTANLGPSINFTNPLNNTSVANVAGITLFVDANKIQSLVKKAYGYRNPERFKTDIFFHLGGLSLYPAPQ